MEQEATEAGTIMRPRTLSRIMLLMASALVAVQSLILMTQISPASFVGLGALSIETISLILLQIIIFSCILGIFCLRSLLDKDGRFRGRFGNISIVSFAIGLILSAEGLVTINLNGSIITGTTSILMICIGLELYTLGILSMTSYVQTEKEATLHGSTPFIAAILFILLMLPTAFIAG